MKKYRQAWNAVIRVRERGFRKALDVFGDFGEVRRTEFFNVLVMQAEDLSQMDDGAAGVARVPRTARPGHARF